MDLAIQACMFLIMFIVGLDLTREDFARLIEKPWVVIAASLAQVVVLPLVAWAIIVVLPLPPHVMAGTVLLAACPGGAISNYYTFIARADVALSVVLTPISTAAAIVKMPIVTAIGFRLFLDEGSGMAAPVGPIAFQVFVYLLLPVVLGMTVRAKFSEATVRHHSTARRVGDVSIFLLVVFLFVKLREFVVDGLVWTILVAALFALAAAAVGLAVGTVLGVGRPQKEAIAIEFACRNNAFIALIGLVVLDRPEFAVFGLVLFVTQIPLVLGGVLAAKRLLAPATSPETE